MTSEHKSAPAASTAAHNDGLSLLASVLNLLSDKQARSASHDERLTELIPRVAACESLLSDLTVKLAADTRRTEHYDEQLGTQIDEIGNRIDKLSRRVKQLTAGGRDASNGAGTKVEERARQVDAIATAPAVPAVKAAKADYVQLVTRIQTAIASCIPAGGNVLFVSRGDEDMLKVQGISGKHFPQGDDGRYAGHYPADGASALAHLQTLQSHGAQYIVFPSTAFWWLDHYAELRSYLQGKCQCLFNDAATAQIYALQGVSVATASAPAAVPSGNHFRSMQVIRRIVGCLLPSDAQVAIVSKGDAELIGFGLKHATAFPEMESDDDAIDQLRQLRARGVEYLVFPQWSFWWLEDYNRFAEHLETNHRRLMHQKNYCLIYDLQEHC